MSGDHSIIKGFKQVRNLYIMDLPFTNWWKNNIHVKTQKAETIPNTNLLKICMENIVETAEKI